MIIRRKARNSQSFCCCARLAVGYACVSFILGNLLYALVFVCANAKCVLTALAVIKLVFRNLWNGFRFCYVVIRLHKHLAHVIQCLFPIQPVDCLQIACRFTPMPYNVLVLNTFSLNLAICALFVLVTQRRSSGSIEHKLSMQSVLI